MALRATLNYNDLLLIKKVHKQPSNKLIKRSIKKGIFLDLKESVNGKGPATKTMLYNT
jgi:hypothetical protein